MPDAFIRSIHWDAASATNVASVPGTDEGKRRLALELAHVGHQSGLRSSLPPLRPDALGHTAERETNATASSALQGTSRPPTNTSVDEGTVMRQPATAGIPPPSLVPDAIQYLRNMASFIAIMRAPGRISTTSLNQTHVTHYLQQARSTYEAQVATLPQNDPLRIDLRAAYVAVLDEIRRAADAALAVAEAQGGAGLAAERGRYAENMAAWIEASPMTSAGLSDTTTFATGDEEVIRSGSPKHLRSSSTTPID